MVGFRHPASIPCGVLRCRVKEEARSLHSSRRNLAAFAAHAIHAGLASALDDNSIVAHEEEDTSDFGLLVAHARTAHRACSTPCLLTRRGSDPASKMGLDFCRKGRIGGVIGTPRPGADFFQDSPRGTRGLGWWGRQLWLSENHGVLMMISKTIEKSAKSERSAASLRMSGKGAKSDRAQAATMTMARIA